MIQPRNTFVVVDLLEKSESKVGQITVPTSGDRYCEAIVVAVGPGTSRVGAQTSETHDLRVGQRVWIQHKDPVNGPIPGQPMLQLAGVMYRIGDKSFYLFGEHRILAILSQPGADQLPN